MGALGALAALLLALFPLGWLASRADRDERFAKRLAGVVALAIFATLVVSIARGDLLRFAPGAQDMTPEEAGGLR